MFGERAVLIKLKDTVNGPINNRIPHKTICESASGNVYLYYCKKINDDINIII